VFVSSGVETVDAARQLAEQRAEEIAADPAHLAEVLADEAAVLNGHCPPADDPEILQRLRLRLDS